MNFLFQQVLLVLELRLESTFIPEILYFLGKDNIPLAWTTDERPY